MKLKEVQSRMSKTRQKMFRARKKSTAAGTEWEMYWQERKALRSETELFLVTLKTLC